MDNNTKIPDTTQPIPDAEEQMEFGWTFHKWPFLIAFIITFVIYLLVFLFVDENPPVYDPAKLPPLPPWG